MSETSLVVPEDSYITLFGEKDAPMPDYIEYSDTRGNEEVTVDDQTTPTFKLVQAINLDEIKALTQGKAESGDLYNTVFNTLHKEVFVLNLYFTKTYTIWKSRKMGGGKIGEYKTQIEAEQALAELPEMPKDMGYDIILTHRHLCALLEVDAEAGKVSIDSPCQFYFKKSSIKPSATWNTDIMTRGGSRYAGIWRVSSHTETSKSGESYKNFDISFAGWAPKPLLKEAEEIYNSLPHVVAKDLPDPDYNPDQDYSEYVETAS